MRRHTQTRRTAVRCRKTVMATIKPRYYGQFSYTDTSLLRSHFRSSNVIRDVTALAGLMLCCLLHQEQVSDYSRLVVFTRCSYYTGGRKARFDCAAIRSIDFTA